MKYLSQYRISDDVPYSMELRFLQNNPDLYVSKKTGYRRIPAKELAESLACRNRKWVLSGDGQVIQNSIETFMAYLEKNPDNQIAMGRIANEKNVYNLYIDHDEKIIVGCIKSTLVPYNPSACLTKSSN